MPRVLLLVTACAAAAPASAAPIALTQDDVALSLYESSGSAWRLLGSAPGPIASYFGPHRCACPVTLAPQLQLTSSGQTNIGQSVIQVEFLLGQSCTTASAACTSVGKVTFSKAQTAAPPTFTSALVYQNAAGTPAASCTGLGVGTTTLWAALSQDGVALPFTPAIELDVVATTIGAPTAATAEPGNGGIVVHWSPPAAPSLVAGYQVLCLPGAAAATAAAYESCGLGSVTASPVLTPADAAQVCSPKVAPAQTSVRISGLTNGTPYTVGVVAIDASGGVSAVSPSAMATPQPTEGFYDKYKAAGGAAEGCAVSGPRRRTSSSLWCCLVLASVLVGRRAGRRRRHAKRDKAPLTLAALGLALATPAQAQSLDVAPMPEELPGPARTHGDDWAANPERSSDDWAKSPTTSVAATPDWGVEIGFSPYRPNVDSEFAGQVHPYEDTFSSKHRLMSEIEVERYLHHGLGSWAVGFRVGYFRTSGGAFLADGTRSADETSLRIIPFSLAAVYRADGLRGLRRLALVPYAKAGLDVAMWTTATTGAASHTGLTPGWHAAAGISLGLDMLFGPPKSGEIAGPGALFFEWDWAQLDGLGLSHRLRVGDSTWYAGLLLDF